MAEPTQQETPALNSANPIPRIFDPTACHDCGAVMTPAATACPLCKSMWTYWRRSDARQAAMDRWAVPLCWTVGILFLVVCMIAVIFALTSFQQTPTNMSVSGLRYMK